MKNSKALILTRCTYVVIWSIFLVVVGQFLASFAYARSECAEHQIQAYTTALKEVSTYPRFMDRPWTSCSGGCVDTSNLTYAALNRMGFTNLKVVFVDSSKSIRGAPARSIWHMFLVDSLSCQDEIIIDPSFKQFFDNTVALEGSDVFVGTRHDLEVYFIENANHINMDDGWSTTHSLNPSPKATCEKIYGYGRGSRQLLSLFRTRKVVEEQMYWKACDNFLKSSGLP